MTPAIRPQERLLLDLIHELPAGRLLCNTAGRAQFAAEFARENSHAQAVCWFLDLYQLQQSEAFTPVQAANLQLLCQSDPPAETFDIVAWMFSRQGNGELTREMLQTGHERLAIGGRMIAAIDNPRDQWLHEQMRGMFDKVTRRPSDAGVVYLATKRSTLRKLKNYAAEFAFRDGERLIQLRTRPGVFSHRELDGGARALVKAMSIAPSIRCLDLGCGSGAVGIAVALRQADVTVNAIDSNPRAIESTLWAADRNGAPSLTATLDCQGSSVAAGTYDLVLANPPYYSDFRIAQLFLNIAARALRSGGRLLLVTKTSQWYTDHLGASFAEVTPQRMGQYTVIFCRRI
jgi:16S rRNA G1207 methylase RsmC